MKYFNFQDSNGLGARGANNQGFSGHPAGNISGTVFSGHPAGNISGTIFRVHQGIILTCKIKLIASKMGAINNIITFNV